MNDRKLFILVNIFSILLLAVVFSFTANASECTSSSIGSRFTTNVERCVPGHISADEMKKNTGSAIELKYISIETLGQRQFPEKELFTDRGDLIIGIDITGNTQGHTYLVINNDRMDGRMFWAAPTLTTQSDQEWVLSRGLILRYKNVPKENKVKLINELKSVDLIKTPTCVAAANVVLFEKGRFQGPKSELTGKAKRFWFPSQFLSFLAREGLVGADGKRLHPEVYTINSDIHMFWNNLPNILRVPHFFFKVLFDPYTWQGSKKTRNQR